MLKSPLLLRFILSYLNVEKTPVYYKIYYMSEYETAVELQ